MLWLCNEAKEILSNVVEQLDNLLLDIEQFGDKTSSVHAKIEDIFHQAKKIRVYHNTIPAQVESASWMIDTDDQPIPVLYSVQRWRVYHIPSGTLITMFSQSRRNDEKVFCVHTGITVDRLPQQHKNPECE